MSRPQFAAIERQPKLDDPDTEIFWQGTMHSELRYQQCGSCGAIVFYPRAHCVQCFAPEPRWEVSSGLGKIYSFTVVRSSRDPVFRSLCPYVLAIVELDEGFRIFTHIDTDSIEDVHLEARVRLTWLKCGVVQLPVFVLESQAPGGERDTAI